MTLARGIDVAPGNQLASAMRYRQWAAAGLVHFVWVEYVRDTRVLGPDSDRHLAAARAAGLLVGAYINLTHGDGAAQMAQFLAVAPASDLPDMLDVEEGTLTEADIRAACDRHDQTGRALAIYTGYWTWLAIVPEAARARYARYPLVIASYPHDAPEDQPQPMDPASVAHRSNPPMLFMPPVPAPWTLADVLSWQYSGHGSLAGYPNFLDLHEAGISLEALRARYAQTPPARPAVRVPRGSLVAIHAIQPGNTLQRVKEAVAAGVPFAAVKLLNDAAALMQIKLASPTTWCYLRYFDPSDDAMQGLDHWTTTQRVQWCTRVLAMIYRQITAEQCAYVDWACAWNEMDPPGAFGYTDLGETFLLLIEMNEARQAQGLTYVKLALGTLAQGTPELWEMEQLYDTGLFRRMHALGYSWDCHEGVMAWEAIDIGYQGKMPSSPAVLALGPGHGDVDPIAGSGLACFRFVWLFEKYLRPAGQLVPLLLGEWYPGKLGEIGRYAWYDDRLSVYEYVTGFAGYNFGPTPDWPNLEPDYESAEFVAWRASRRDRINGGLMPAEVSDADLALLVANNQSSAAILAKYQTLPGKHLMAALTNQQVINLFDRVLSVPILEQQLTSAQDTLLAGNRQTLYTGPAVENMPHLTDAQKALVIAALPQS